MTYSSLESGPGLQNQMKFLKFAEFCGGYIYNLMQHVERCSMPRHCHHKQDASSSKAQGVCFFKENLDPKEIQLHLLTLDT